MEIKATTDLIREAAKYASVLDVGCGSGAQLIRCRGPKVRLGIDICEAMLKRGQDFIAKHSLEGIELVQANLAQLDILYTPDLFECVYGMDIVEHFEKDDACALIDNCERLASKLVMFFIPVGDHPQTTDDRHVGNEHYMTHRSTWYPEDMTSRGYDVWYFPDRHSKRRPWKKSNDAMWCAKTMSVTQSEGTLYTLYRYSKETIE